MGELQAPAVAEDVFGIDPQRLEKQHADHPEKYQYGEVTVGGFRVLFAQIKQQQQTGQDGGNAVYHADGEQEVLDHARAGKGQAVNGLQAHKYPFLIAPVAGDGLQSNVTHPCCKNAHSEAVGGSANCVFYGALFGTLCVVWSVDAFIFYGERLLNPLYSGLYLSPEGLLSRLESSKEHETLCRESKNAILF